jgi:hypothetical protein
MLLARPEPVAAAVSAACPHIAGARCLPPGSARVSRVGLRVPRKRTFSPIYARIISRLRWMKSTVTICENASSSRERSPRQRGFVRREPANTAVNRCLALTKCRLRELQREIRPRR